VQDLKVMVQLYLKQVEDRSRESTDRLVKKLNTLLKEERERNEKLIRQNTLLDVKCKAMRRVEAGEVEGERVSEQKVSEQKMRS